MMAKLDGECYAFWLLRKDFKDSLTGLDHMRVILTFEVTFTM